MTILVTGSSGFLGQHLILGMAAQGWGGVAVSRTIGAVGLPRGWFRAKRAQVMPVGSRNEAVDAVVHLEVKQHVLYPTAADRKEFRLVNVEGTQDWLDWCARNGVTCFVYFSSIKAVRPAAYGPTDESATGPPSSIYGVSKWDAEERVRAWVAADPQRSALILRPAVIYGPGSTANITAMVDGIQRGRFFLVGENENIKSLVAVRNVVAAATYVLPRMEKGRCEVFCLVDAQSLTVRELDSRIRKLLGRSGNSPSLPLQAARLAAWSGDAIHRLVGCNFPINSSRLAALREITHFSPAKLLSVGFRHPQSLDEGLEDLVAWCCRSARHRRWSQLNL